MLRWLIAMGADEGSAPTGLDRLPRPRHAAAPAPPPHLLRRLFRAPSAPSPPPLPCRSGNRPPLAAGRVPWLAACNSFADIAAALANSMPAP